MAGFKKDYQPFFLSSHGMLVDSICIHDLITKKEEIIPLESGESRGSLDTSPDGKMVLFFNDGEFKVLRISPRDFKSIPDHPDSTNGAGIVFSPDGKEIFRRLRNGRPGFVATNIDSGKHRIIEFIKISEKVSYLDLSPDGKKVAYLSESRSEIKLHDLENELTETLNLSNGLSDCKYSFVRWSPDSNRLAYYSYSDNAKNKCLGIFNDRDDSDYVVLKSEKIWGFWNRPPQWSPDGQSFCLTMEEDQIMEISILSKIRF